MLGKAVEWVIWFELYTKIINNLDKTALRQITICYSYHEESKQAASIHHYIRDIIAELAA